ncbi:hypothetical protein [Rhodopseudomonas sp.]|uniref:hypothetical protein n=1 Tax=Rhodopseudomonas sp. TaxID=1078 RepID=UPI003B3ACF65
MQSLVRGWNVAAAGAEAREMIDRQMMSPAVSLLGLDIRLRGVVVARYRHLGEAAAA